MAKTNMDAREKIITATTNLIKEYGDISKITIRDIAAKSEVGVGLINYHFQTKENLIDTCILRIISQFIGEIERMYQNLGMSLIDRVKYVFKLISNFLVSNPGISKISMILDLSSSEITDNTDQAARIHFKALREIFGEEKTDEEVFIILHILMSSIQVAFLRSNVFKNHTGIDFHDNEQRDRFIDELVDKLIGTVNNY